jgi:DNA-binding SARP family transcriptional activator
MTSLQLLWLGDPVVLWQGQPLKFATRKTLALLVYLTVEKQPHRREWLMTLFWPESDTRRAQGSLRNTLSYLRQALQPAAAPLRVDDLTLAFDVSTSYTLDVELLHTGTATTDSARQQAAVAAYRGDFLAGFTLDDAPEFDNWASLQRSQCQHHFTQVCERLVQALTTQGDQPAALTVAQRWQSYDPLAEAAYRHLIQIHLALGERSTALQIYERCRAIFADELGVQPSPALEALVAPLRLTTIAAPSRLPPPAPPPRNQPAASSAPRIAVSPSAFELPFTGRADEYSRLTQAWYTASAGQPQVVLLEGEAGIGKTRLATEFWQ